MVDLTYPLNENEINDWTGFEEGLQFKNEDEVREYFTLENVEQMFGGDTRDLSQEELDIMANAVIQNRWHMLVE